MFSPFLKHGLASHVLHEMQGSIPIIINYYVQC